MEHPSPLRAVPRGRAVAALRALLDIPAEDVAARAGISPVRLCRVERAQRQLLAGEFSRLLNAIASLIAEHEAREAGRMVSADA